MKFTLCGFIEKKVDVCESEIDLPKCDSTICKTWICDWKFQNKVFQMFVETCQSDSFSYIYHDFS